MDFEKEFTISYGVSFYSGRMRVGVFEVESDNIEEVQRQAMKLVLEKFEDDYDDYEGSYLDEIKSIRIDVIDPDEKEDTEEEKGE